MHETEIERMIAEAGYVVAFVRAVTARGLVPDVEAALQYRRDAKALTWAVDDYSKTAPANDRA